MCCCSCPGESPSRPDTTQPLVSGLTGNTSFTLLWLGLLECVCVCGTVSPCRASVSSLLVTSPLMFRWIHDGVLGSGSNLPLLWVWMDALVLKDDLPHLHRDAARTFLSHLSEQRPKGSTSVSSEQNAFLLCFWEALLCFR